MNVGVAFRKLDRLLLACGLATLERDVNELALFSRTAVTLLIEKGIFTGDEFVTRMKEVDRSDGTEDGRYDDSKVSPAGPGSSG